jgi:hypothetical protein
MFFTTGGSKQPRAITSRRLLSGTCSACAVTSIPLRARNPFWPEASVQDPALSRTVHIESHSLPGQAGCFTCFRASPSGSAVSREDFIQGIQGVSMLLSILDSKPNSRFSKFCHSSDPVSSTVRTRPASFRSGSTATNVHPNDDRHGIWLSATA